MNRTLKNPVTVYTVDLAKNTFQVHGYTASGERCLQRRLSRSQFDTFLRAGTQRVVMEACGSSHHWSRTLQARGYRTELVPPQFVARHRHGTKTDGHDADAIYAVHRDPRVHPVPTKTVAEQDLCALHRLRELLTKQHTACRNQARGLLAERGVIAPRGERGWAALRLRASAGEAGEVTPALAQVIAVLEAQLTQLDERLAAIDRQLAGAVRTSALAQRVDEIFGVGPVIATALTAEFGQGMACFAGARAFAAHLGLTPSEHSSGDRRRLGGITRRGNAYLRKLLVQGGQSVISASARHPDDALCQLAQRLLAAGKRRGVVAVAIANRLARISYAVLRHGTPYHAGGRPQPHAA